MDKNYNGLDIYRLLGKGEYYTDFSWLKPGVQFPNREVMGRNAVYKYNKRLFTGEYGRNKRLLIYVDGIEKSTPYQMINVNFFKLIINKIISLIFSNDALIKSGNIERDKEIANLVERTRWQESIKRFVKTVEIYGDGILKTYRNGVSAIAPLNGFKVVSGHNKQEVIGYVLYNLIIGEYEDTYIRFEIHQNGRIFEVVYSYDGNDIFGNLIQPVDFNYNGREISKYGNVYDTGINDCSLVQWGTLNQEADGVYGQSSFMDIKDLVFTLEQRLSSELYIMNAHEKPLIVAGLENFRPNENGGYELKVLNDMYLISEDGNSPKYMTWDGKLDNSREFREDLLSIFYELSELGKTYLSGEYTGNISEETLNNTIKSAIDRGNRDSLELYYPIKNSLYTLCRLNNIDLRPEELTIDFSIGRTDDDKQVAEIIKIVTESGILSKQTMLEKYFGYNSEQAQAEMEKINLERMKGGTVNG